MIDISSELNNLSSVCFNRRLYCRELGQLQENIITDIFLDLDFEILVHKLYSNGLDLVVYKNEEVVLTAEIINEFSSSYVNTARARSMYNNFYEYPNVPHLLFAS